MRLIRLFQLFPQGPPFPNPMFTLFLNSKEEGHDTFVWKHASTLDWCKTTSLVFNIWIHFAAVPPKMFHLFSEHSGWHLKSETELKPDRKHSHSQETSANGGKDRKPLWASHLMSSSVTTKALQRGCDVLSHTPGFFSTAAVSCPVTGAGLVCRALAKAESSNLSEDAGPTPKHGETEAWVKPQEEGGKKREKYSSDSQEAAVFLG